MTIPTVPLGTVLKPRNEIVHPRDLPMGIGRFIGLEHIEPQTGRRIGELEIRLEELTGRKARFRAADIVYGYLRPYLNKVWLADFDGYCSVDQYVFAVDAARADPRYVADFMRSPAYLTAAPIDTTPGYLPRIRTEEVLSVRIPLPSLADQRRIAEQLTGQLTAVDRAREAIRVRFDAVRTLRIQAVGSAFDAIIDAPRVPVGRLGDLTDGDWILNSDYADSGVRLLQLGDVGSGRLTLRSSRFISSERAQELNCTMLRPGDILISRMPDPIGRACILPNLGFSAITAVDVTIFRPSDRVVDREFVTQFMNSPQWLKVVAGKASGATRPRISRKNLGLLTVPAPSIEIQRAIAAKLRLQLATIDAMTVAVEAQYKAVEALPSVLLRRAFDDMVA